MRWGILALLFWARVGMGLQFQTLGSVGGDLGVAFGLDYAGIGLLIGLFMAPGLVLALPAGLAGRYASDRALAVSGRPHHPCHGIVCIRCTCGICFSMVAKGTIDPGATSFVKPVLASPQDQASAGRDRATPTGRQVATFIAMWGRHIS